MESKPTQVFINDDARLIGSDTTISMLLDELKLVPKFLAVEVNRRVIPRNEHSVVMLQDGDRIEIVTLVGGG